LRRISERFSKRGIGITKKKLQGKTREKAKLHCWSGSAHQAREEKGGFCREKGGKRLLEGEEEPEGKVLITEPIIKKKR